MLNRLNLHLIGFSICQEFNGLMSSLILISEPHTLALAHAHTAHPLQQALGPGASGGVPAGCPGWGRCHASAQ